MKTAKKRGSILISVGERFLSHTLVERVTPQRKESFCVKSLVPTCHSRRVWRGGRGGYYLLFLVLRFLLVGGPSVHCYDYYDFMGGVLEWGLDL